MAILVRSLDEVVRFVNQYAPEHLILSVENSRQLAEEITNAGSVFLGNYSPESLGDYASGTNHVLPTNGNAKAYSGVSLDTFLKAITFQEASAAGLNQLAAAVECMAAADSLEAHKNAVNIRRRRLGYV
jgi:histidinol dehydrogenase